MAENLNGGSLIRHLQGENERLQQTVMQQQQALLQRAEPIAQAVLDTLLQWCQIAEQPGHPAQAVAVDLLKKWLTINRRAERATSSIVVAQDVPRAD